MGSVIDYIECPNCKSEAYNDFYYKTGEEYTNCNNCGYHRSATIINRAKPLNTLTDEDWQITELKSPYGAFRIKYYDSPATHCGPLETEASYEELKESIYQNELIPLEYVSVSRFVNGEIVVEYIVDNGPKEDSAGFTQEDR